MRFRATIKLGGKTATGIQVPAEIVESLGSSKRPAVRVTINGYTYRSTVASWAGSLMLPVSAEQSARMPVSPPETRSMSTSSSIPRLAR